MAKSGIAVVVNPAFLDRIRTLGVALKPALVEAMDGVMQEVERLARSTADWNPDGTIIDAPGIGRYSVTGAARQSITAYAVGAERDPQHNFRITDPESGKVHESVTIQPPEDEPTVVKGVVEMAEDHSAYLQAYEQRGPSEISPNLFGGGRTIVTEVLEQNAEWVMNSVAAEAAILLKAL